MHPGLADFVNSRLVATAPSNPPPNGSSPDERAIAGNFRMEERLSQEIQDSYDGYFDGDTISSLDEWRGFHKDFLDDHVNLIGDDEHPWTFREDNRANLRPQDPISILRMESLEAAIRVSGTSLSVVEIEQRIRELHTGTDEQKRAADTILTRFVSAWNRRRDRRPQFATNQAGVQDILPADPWAGTDWGWVADLRDHLGLGAYTPKASGEPFPVLMMVYSLSEMVAGCRPAWDGRVAVPTVLDGDLYTYFFPSPLAPDPDAAGEHYPVGRTLNLSPGLNVNNYGDCMGTEFLHPCFDYQPQHCWAVGYIERPLAAAPSLPERRKCHLEWVRLWADHFTFGEGVPL